MHTTRLKSNLIQISIIARGTTTAFQNRTTSFINSTIIKNITLSINSVIVNEHMHNTKAL